MVFAVDPAITDVGDSVPLSATGMLHKGAGHKHLTVIGECHRDGIVHTGSHERLDPGAIRPHAENVSGLAFPSFLVGEVVRLLGKGSFAPIDPPIGPGKRPMKVVGTARQRFAIVPDVALLGHPIPVGISQLPDLRRTGNIKRPMQPHNTLR